MFAVPGDWRIVLLLLHAALLLSKAQESANPHQPAPNTDTLKQQVEPAATSAEGIGPELSPILSGTPAPISPDGKASGTVGLCAIAKDEQGNLKDWVSYHLWLGAAIIYVFDHGSHPPLADELEEYVRAGKVEVVYFSNSWATDKREAAPLHPPPNQPSSPSFATSPNSMGGQVGEGGRPSFEQQSPSARAGERQTEAQLGFPSPQAWAYDRCFRWFGGRHAWLGLLDPDEYLVISPDAPPPPLPSPPSPLSGSVTQIPDANLEGVPQAVPSPSDTLQDEGTFLGIELAKYSAWGGVMIHWQLMGPSGQESHPLLPTPLAYTNCVPPTFILQMAEFKKTPMGFMKSFTQTRYYTGGGCDPHHCALAPGAPPYVTQDFVEVTPVSASLFPLKPPRMQVFHYVTRSLEDYQKKQSRGSGHSQYIADVKAKGIKGRGWEYFQMIVSLSQGTECLDAARSFFACCDDKHACSCDPSLDNTQITVQATPKSTATTTTASSAASITSAQAGEVDPFAATTTSIPTRRRRRRRKAGATAGIQGAGGLGEVVGVIPFSLPPLQVLSLSPAADPKSEPEIQGVEAEWPKVLPQLRENRGMSSGGRQRRRRKRRSGVQVLPSDPVQGGDPNVVQSHQEEGIEEEQRMRQRGGQSDATVNVEDVEEVARAALEALSRGAGGKEVQT